jgi:hypothetical protein
MAANWGRRPVPIREEPLMVDTPFDTLESAHDFVKLLREHAQGVEGEVLEDIGVAAAEGAARRLDALRLVHYKLKQLNDHLGAGSRILNDLRALRRLLTGDGREPGRPAVPAALETATSASASL